MTSCRNRLAVCANSDGGPDLNLGEHSAGNSTFGTVQQQYINNTLYSAGNVNVTMFDVYN